MKIRYILGGAALLLMGLTSCEDYLDKAPDSDISSTEAYKNFTNFQGFVEELYNLPPDIMKCNWVSSFNWGDDELISTGNGNYLFGNSVDRGNYRDYINKGDCFLQRTWDSGNNRFNKDIWGSSWYGIRKCNMGLEALEKGLMTDATQEERDVVKGQLLFYRAWFYFELTSYWGGLPYIDYVLPADAIFDLPRVSYREDAEKMAADFEAASELLPIDWDNTTVGRRTLGNNALRPNKIWALCYLGKTYLYAGSPLMYKGTSGNPTDYDPEMCKKAADVFGNVLKMVEGGETQYALVEWKNYSNLFYTNLQNWLMPGGTEAIMRSPTYGADSYWRQANSYQISSMAQGDNIILLPAANYVNYFGMANGLPLDDPDSKFDKTHPWKDRDPRFYNDFVYDGEKVVKAEMPAEFEPLRYAGLYGCGTANPGEYCKDPNTTSRTGYLMYKFIGRDFNNWDKNYDYGHATHLHLSWMRLADVYLMYAEAVAEGYGSATSKAGGFAKSAADAVNTIRTRAGVANIADKYLANKESFMGEVRRERAVELAFEGLRFNDLRRWLLLTRAPYNIKTRQVFDRAKDLDPNEDSREREVKNWKEEVIITRNLGAKHYWLPFNLDDVSMYPEFNQNPGW